MAISPLGLAISGLINITVNLAPTAAINQNLSGMLVLGSTQQLVGSTYIDIIDSVERYRTYTSSTSVATDFGSTAPEYLSAVLWFQQFPNSQLLIGKWAKANCASALRGGSVTSANQVISTWVAMTAANFNIVIDNVPLAINLTGSPFSSVTSMTGVASVLQTAIQAQATAAGYSAAASIVCVWNSVYSRFEIYSGTTTTQASTYLNTTTTPGSSVAFLAQSVAVGFYNFTANPTAGSSSITINGDVWSFVSSITTGNQILVGASVAATLINTLNALNAYAAANSGSNTAKATYSVAGNYLYLKSKVTGTAGNAYTIVATGTGAPTVSAATLSGGASTAYDISSTIAGLSTSGGYVVPQQPAESALSAATLFDNQYGQKWYGLNIIGLSYADIGSTGAGIAQFIESTTNKHTFWYTANSSNNALDAGAASSAVTTDIGSVMSAYGLNKTFIQYSSQNQYAVISAAAKYFQVNYSGNNTVIDLMYKQEPGIVAEQLTQTQANTLQSKYYNVFVQYNNNTAIMQWGRNISGIPMDTIIGLDNLVISLQTAWFNQLYLSPTKLPQTDQGVAVLVTLAEQVLYGFVVDGFLAPGVWNQVGFGSLNQYDFLNKGYYVYANPIATQSAAARSLRQTPLIQIAVKLAGAIEIIISIVSVNQ